jgi:ArsR family transcriptional regulator
VIAVAKTGAVVYRIYTMAERKTQKFDKDAVRLADLAKALAHPARITIVQILMEKNVCICGELVDELPLSQSTVSQHLKELKRVGLIKGEIEPPKTCYCLDLEVVQEACDAFAALFSPVCET